MARLTLHIDVEPDGSWSLRALAPEDGPNGESQPPTLLGERAGDHGFTTEEDRLAVALSILDEALDLSNNPGPLTLWWVDTWARYLDKVATVDAMEYRR